VLADTGITLSQLHAVELIGGATRVPKLQAVLGAYVGKQGLDRHLDADEAVSLGAALQAANLSDGFKLNRKIGMVDGSTYGIVIEMDGATLESKDQKLLVPRMKKLPSKLFRSLKNQKQDFKCTLKYDETDVLPPSSASPVIAKYEISGVAEAAAKYASHNLSAPIKTNLHFSLSRSGLVHLDKAETVVEISEWVDVPVLESNSTSLPSNDTSEVEGIGQQSSETASGDANVTSATENVKPTMKQKLRKRTIRIPLKINDVTEGRLTESSLATSALQLEKLNLQDAEKRQTAEAKNSLESYIYATKDKLESLEDLEKVSSEQQRDALHVELGEAEDWLYTDGEHATAAEFTMRLQALESSAKPIFFRLQELTSRPSAVQEARTYLEDIKQVLQGWETRKPWLSAKSIEEVHTELKTVQGWLDTVELRQQKTPGDVEPAFTSDDVFARTEKIREQVSKLERIPKPKAEKPANTSNTDGGSSSDSSEKSTAEDEKLEEQHVEENGDSEPPEKKMKFQSQEEGVDQAGHDEL
jgi:hypoxia up-regulated 1